MTPKEQHLTVQQIDAVANEVLPHFMWREVSFDERWQTNVFRMMFCDYKSESIPHIDVRYFKREMEDALRKLKTKMLAPDERVLWDHLEGKAHVKVVQAYPDTEQLALPLDDVVHNSITKPMKKTWLRDRKIGFAYFEELSILALTDITEKVDKWASSSSNAPLKF